MADVASMTNEEVLAAADRIQRESAQGFGNPFAAGGGLSPYTPLEREQIIGRAAQIRAELAVLPKAG